MSREFWQLTVGELASPRPGGIPVGVIYAYRVAMFCLNGLNYFWFSQMVRIALFKDGTAAIKTD